MFVDDMNLPFSIDEIFFSFQQIIRKHKSIDSSLIEFLYMLNQIEKIVKHWPYQILK